MKSDDNTSKRYIGENGKEYFQWQNALDKQIGVFESEKFSKYIKKEDVVADFGCGGGHLLANLECREKIGIEINLYARKRAEKYGFTVYEDLSHLEGDGIDTFISNHALEHVICPITTLKQIKEKLRHDGKLILCLPIDDWRKQKKYKKDINNHLYTWTPQLIGNSLLESGFKVEKIHIINRAWLPQFVAVYKYFPKVIFQILCYLTAVLLKSRQIMAVATKI